MRRLLEVLLSLLAAVICLLTVVIFANVAAAQGHAFPFPALYLLEIALVGAAGLPALWQRAPAWLAARWASAGILLAFSILGAFTLGPFVLPAALALLAAAAISSQNTQFNAARGLAWFGAAALGQAGLMLLFVQLSMLGVLP